MFPRPNFVYTYVFNKYVRFLARLSFGGKLSRTFSPHSHLQKNHVMKKLSKEIGFSVLMSMTGANATMIKEVLHTLSSSAYDRNLEREADMESVNYMINANIDPRPFADFLYELSLDNELHKYTYWVSTHPESEARAKTILNYLKTKKSKKPLVVVASFPCICDHIKTFVFPVPIVME